MNSLFVELSDLESTSVVGGLGIDIGAGIGVSLGNCTNVGIDVKAAVCLPLGISISL